MRVLLVEDSPTLRAVERQALQEAGYLDVIEAGDGLEALHRLTLDRPDIMLVDWNMPRLDGAALTRRIRHADRSLPVIVMMAEADRARVLQAVQAGANNYITKPFCADSLAEKIRQTLAITPVPT